MADDYKICLSAVGKPRKVVSISQDETVEDVNGMAQNLFGFTQATLKAGFPPRPVPVSVEKARSVFSKNERVQVEEVSSPPDNNKKAKQQNGATGVASMPSGRSTSKRSAAKAATASFKHVIRAQEQAMQQEKQKTQKKRSRSAMSGNNSSTRNTNSNAAAQRRMARMPGRRLADGDRVGPASPPPRQQRKSSGPKWSSQDDVSFALLSALNSGGGGKVGQVLRGAMRNAVSNQYEASRAVVRVAAVQAGKYTIDVQGEEQDRIKVSYSKGLEGRGNYEETVDLVPREALKAVVTAIHNSTSNDEASGGREMLRPTHLAQLSPRVFWSLLKDGTARSVQDALHDLLPSLEWSYLKTRTKTLSAKAKENLRQQQQQEQNGGNEANLEAAEEAVHAVEQAMDQLHRYDQDRRRDRAARAAVSRQQQLAQEEGTWCLNTPSELDQDELGECIQENLPNGATPQQVQAWIRCLIDNGIRNWRQLANATPPMVGQLVGLEEAQVEPWLDYAQQESIEEIIVEICDGRPEAVDVLRHEARSGTPKDLSNWRSLPDMLYNEAPSLGTMNVTVQELAAWCQRAHQALQDYEWLEWYATPVSS